MSAPIGPPPLWLFDIDGVVNALPLGVGWPADQRVQRMMSTQIPKHGMVTLPILVARPVLEFIAGVTGLR